MHIKQEFKYRYAGLVPFKVIQYNGAKIYDATTRTAFCEFVDYLHRADLITDKQAQNATFEPRQR